MPLPQPGSLDTAPMYSLIFLALAYPLFKLAKFIYEGYTSPLKRLPGPKSTSWIYGNFREIWENVLHFHCYYSHSFFDVLLGSFCSSREMGLHLWPYLPI